MQGRGSQKVSRESAIGWLTEALDDLGEHAAQYGVPLIYEPLNRYETNIVNTQADGVALLKTLKTANVKLLADLFHMNIEETNIAGAIRLRPARSATSTWPIPTAAPPARVTLASLPSPPRLGHWL